jgi:hypothetical protein
MVQLSNEFVAIGLALGIALWLAYKGKNKLYRILGSASVILVGLGFGTIDTTAPFVIIMGLCFVAGGLKLFEEISDLIK